MPKRIALKLINWLWYSTALIIVCAAILVSVGREVLPRINLANDDLLQYINQRTGAKIQAEQLNVQWESIYPEISAKQLLIDTQDAHVQLDGVQITLNIAQSLFRLTPVIDRMKLARADIHYTLPEASHSIFPDIDSDWRFINRLFNNDVQISNIAITLQRGDWSRSLELDDLRVEQGFIHKKFFLRLLDKKNQQSLSMTGRFNGDTLRDSRGLLYIKTDRLTLKKWAPTLLQNSALSGEAWVQWSGRHQADITTHMQLTTPPNNDTTNAQLPPLLNAALSMHWEKESDSYIDIHNILAKDNADGANTAQLSDVRVTFNTENFTQWQVQSPALYLDSITPAARYLPDGEVKKLFTSLNLHGYLRNLNIAWDNTKPLTERMTLQANADTISSGHWDGVPAFTGVSGYIRSGIGYGFIDLNSNNGFSMHYPEVYHEPIIFQRAAGRVQWQWLPEQKTVFVGSDYASLSGEAGEARGNFWLHLPLHGADFHSEMYLAIGLRNSQARYRDMLIPFILPHDLLAWLKTSIKDATLPDAGFLYRGGLTGAEAHESAIQFYTHIQQGELEFHPDWPALKNIDATLLVDNHNAYVHAQHAQMYNTNIDSAAVEVLQEHPGLVINVNGRAQGAPQDGLTLLRQTPLHRAIGDGMDNWNATSGSLTTALQLQIPLSGAPLPQTENVQLQLSDAQIDMKDLRLPFSNINSQISYDTDNGLQAPTITATLFNKPVSARIESHKNAQHTTIDISANSNANISDIAQWSKLKPLKMLSGSADYQATLQLGPFGNTQPTARIGQLQISSNLNQVAAELPEPFAKKRGTNAPLHLTVNLLRDNKQEYAFNYNKQVTGALVVRNNQLTGGDIALLSNTANTPVEDNSLQIHGSLPNANIQQWIDLINRYNQLGDDKNNTIIFPTLQLHADSAVWKDITLPALQLSAQHNERAWQLTFASANAQGKALFYDDGKTPAVIIDTLKLQRDTTPNTTSNTQAAATNLANQIDFSAVPPMNIRINHLFMNGMDIGHFSTALRSTPNTLRFENLMATGNGYLLRDGSGLNGSTLIWRKNADGSNRSEFHGLLQMSGEQPVLKHLGIDPFIIGKRISLYADITWPDTPQAISAHTIAGNVYTEGKDGKYLQAKPNIAMHALGVVNIATWIRRLQLNFSDLSNDGISFDEYKGKLQFGNNTMRFIEPLEMEGPSGEFRLSGKALLDTNTLDLRLVATLPVSNNATWVAAIAGGLPAAAGVYLASKVFDKQIDSLSSLSYSITGSMEDSQINFERIAPPEEKTKSAATKTTAAKTTATKTTTSDASK
jgi:uncharacterized protein (TIGR02099 family)